MQRILYKRLKMVLLNYLNWNDVGASIISDGRCFYYGDFYGEDYCLCSYID